MKPTPMHEDVITEGNLDLGEKIVMDLSLDDREHIMAVLSNLYSDRIGACVREYSTNALDAHLMVGNTAPIEISLPGALSQYFKVRDYGPGLTLTEIREIFRLYGASTKRASDVYNGTLGFGSKSALTYTPTFTITSVSEGRKVQIIVTKNGDGIGELNVVSDEATTEASGVEVSIPVKYADIHTFQRTAQRFFRWWDPATFRGVSTAHPTPVDTFDIGGRKVSSYRRNEVSEDLIIMGGVAYPIPYEGGLFETERDFSIVYFAEMGEVKFSPSRESLITNGLTQGTVDKVREQFKKNLIDSLQGQVTAAKSFGEALMVSEKSRAKYSKLDLRFNYRGEEVPAFNGPLFHCPTETRQAKDYRGNPIIDPTTQKPKMETVDIPFHCVRPEERTLEVAHSQFTVLHRYWVDETNRYSVEGLGKTVIVTGAPRNITAAHRKIVRDYNYLLDGKSYDYYWLSPADDAPGGKWLDVVKTVTWDDMKKVVRDSVSTSGTTDRTLYEVWDDKGGRDSRRIPDNEVILYTTGAINRESEGRFTLSSVVKYLPKMGYKHVAVMNRNRWAKFKREHPNSKEFTEAYREYLVKWYDGLSADDKRALDVYTVFRGENLTSTYSGISEAQLPDLADKALAKVLQEWYDVKARGEELTRDLSVIINSYRHLRIHLTNPTDKSRERLSSELTTFEFYEDRISGVDKRYRVEVANAVYHYMKKKGN